MLKIFLLRHAKSNHTLQSLGDFNRPLKKRGIKDIRFMAHLYSKRYGLIPDAMISSSARRALETAQLFAKEINYSLNNIMIMKNIYEATLEDLIEIVKDIDDRYSSVFIVGHNPGFTELANYIASGVDIDNIPTCGLVGVKFNLKSWNKIGEKLGNLFCFEYPDRHKTGK